MLDVRRARSADKEVSDGTASVAVREQRTTFQAGYFTLLSANWGIDRNYMIFRPTAWTAEDGRL